MSASNERRPRARASSSRSVRQGGRLAERRGPSIRHIESANEIAFTEPRVRLHVDSARARARARCGRARRDPRTCATRPPAARLPRSPRSSSAGFEQLDRALGLGHDLGRRVAPAPTMNQTWARPSRARPSHARIAERRRGLERLLVHGARPGVVRGALERLADQQQQVEDLRVHLGQQVAAPARRARGPPASSRARLARRPADCSRAAPRRASERARSSTGASSVR